MIKYLKLLVLAAFLSPAAGHATIIYNTWTSNETPVGNYILTIEQDAGDSQFDVSLTVAPWNAEALGLFIDLGDVDVGAVVLTDVTPVGEVAVFATDTTSDSCGQGCNLNGLSPPIASPDGEWELVFRLAGQGYDSIQTFSFSINDFGLTENAWGMVGIRAQQLCSGDDTLPDGSCDGSDKVYATGPGGGGPGGGPVPEPGLMVLLGTGLLGMAVGGMKRAKRRRRQDG